MFSIITSVSHDPSETILICWFGAQKHFFLSILKTIYCICKMIVFLSKWFITIIGSSSFWMPFLMIILSFFSHFLSSVLPVSGSPAVDSLCRLRVNCANWKAVSLPAKTISPASLPQDWKVKRRFKYKRNKKISAQYIYSFIVPHFLNLFCLKAVDCCLWTVLESFGVIFLNALNKWFDVQN